ncbi:MAG TPA: hypothetical protein PLU50_09405 [Pseudobdellovibrionaceae bacterium]|nr:hypothetical protein [Pseudobdellovibrionaceae bacterium]
MMPNKLMSILVILVIGMILSLESHAQFKIDKKTRTQELDFEALALQGQIRTPEGAFLMHKRGLKFRPITQLQKDIDLKIRQQIGRWEGEQ